MEASKQTFRHSFVQLAFMSLGGFALLAAAYIVSKTNYSLVSILIIGFVVLIYALYATSSVRISDVEITTSRLFSSKSLRWSEIARISMRGQNLRLHNHDEDVILSIDSQLDGYKEILDIIFSRRPDLVDGSETTSMSSGWRINLLIVGFGLLIIILSVFAFFVPEEEFDKIFSVILFALGVSVIVIWFLSPKGISLEDKILLVRYFFREASYTPEEIDSIFLERRTTKDGYVYFVQVKLKSGKKIRLPTFKPGAAITYQLLKKWHEKAVSKGMTRLSGV